MDCFYWTTIIGLTLIIGRLTAWRFRELDQKIEELRNELRETQREQGETNKHLLEQLKMDSDPRYEAIVQMMTKEQSMRKKNDEAIDGQFGIVDKLIRYIAKLENDHSSIVAAQQAKIDHLEEEIHELKEDIRDSKAEQREALGNMEEQVQRECREEIAALEKKGNDNHQIVNETLHGITELLIKRAREQSKNDTAALAKEIQQIKKHVIVQNEVIVGYQLQVSTHHYRNLGAQYGAMAGEHTSGHVQDMVTGLWSQALSLLASLK